MKICFLVGSMSISGGTYVIVQHASYLRDRGYDVTLAVQEPFSETTLSWHDEASKLHCLPIDEAKSGSYDLVIATWWKTAFELAQFDARHHAYFVQSIESRFYPESEVPLRELVDATYTMPIQYVTEAVWIQQYLESRFQQRADLVRNGIRKDIYREAGNAISPRPSRGQPRVLVEGHFGVAFKNTALAIQLAKRAGAKDIWVLTGSPVKWLPGVERVFSRVPMTQTPDIYRSCDILIKLSTVEGMFGPPLEMFHCGGTSVVFDVTGHDEYIVDGKNAGVVPAGDLPGVVRTVQHLLDDPAYLDALKAGARETAEQWPSWTDASERFRQWVEDCMSTATVDRGVLAEMTQRAFAEYGEKERNRLGDNPSIVRRHKVSAFLSRFPNSVRDMAKKAETIVEVMLPRPRAF